MEAIFILLIVVIVSLIFYTRNLQKNIDKEISKYNKVKEEITVLKSELDILEACLKAEKTNGITEKEDYEIRLKEETSKQAKLKENIKTLQEDFLNKARELQDLQEKLKEEYLNKKRIEKELLDLKILVEQKEQEEARRRAEILEEKRIKGTKILAILYNIENKKRCEEAQRMIEEANELEKQRIEEERKKQDEIHKLEEERKKIEKERQDLEIQQKNKEEQELQSLQKKFKSIGARMKWKIDESDNHLYSFQNYYICEVTSNENIILDKLFALFVYGGSYKILGKYYSYNINFVCYINDIYKEYLLKIKNGYRSIEIYLGIENETKIFNKDNYKKQAKDFLFCYLESRKIKRLEDSIVSIIENGINHIKKLSIKGDSIEEKVCSALTSSNYDIEFQKSIVCAKDNDMLIVEYELPNMSNFSEVKEYKYIASSKEIRTKTYTESYIAKRYENVLYSITLRSLYEIFSIDTENEINGITFNGFVTQVNPATGIIERKCILSLQVDRQKFSQINLSQVEPKACFKALKGVSAAKLVDISPITPILTFNKKDKRFVEGKDVEVNQGTNLAAMHWEDFEHLVRELFEMEFARNGGEVRVTQASRDGGVDAIVFDPDPLRGGKIVIQAKRYTNTVGVSAVRDLYGTVINEGANSGILITTSDYGHDSYEFAKDKPLKLLNGGHLLALLHKNGRNAHINIEEAKKINEENRNS